MDSTTIMEVVHYLQIILDWDVFFKFDFTFNFP